MGSTVEETMAQAEQQVERDGFLRAPYADLVSAVAVAASDELTGSATILRLARLDVAEPVRHMAPEFRGTPMGELTQLSRWKRPRPPKHPAGLVDHLRSAGLITGDFASEALTYLSFLSLGTSLGWERTLDIHAAATLLAERTSPPYSRGAVLSPTWEDSAFAWLHDQVHRGPPPADWAQEVSLRQAVRQQLLGQPFDVAAAAVCEAPLPAQVREGVRRFGGALTRDDVVTLWEESARGMPGPAERWRERIRHLDDTGPLATTDTADAMIIGHATGWLIRHGIPVDRRALAFIEGYAAIAAVALAQDAPGHHTWGVPTFHHDGAHEWWASRHTLPLSLDLALLAWALEQTGVAVPFHLYLRSRNTTVPGLRSQVKPAAPRLGTISMKRSRPRLDR